MGPSSKTINAEIAFLSFPYLYRFTSCQEADFSPSCHSKPIWFLQLPSHRGEPENPGIQEFQKGSLSFQEISPLSCFSTYPFFFVSYRSEDVFFLNSLVQQCSNTKVTGGELSRRAAVRLTVTQFTDSQTTRDLFNLSLFFDLSETPFIDGTIHMQSHSFQLFTEANWQVPDCITDHPGPLDLWPYSWLFSYIHCSLPLLTSVCIFVLLTVQHSHYLLSLFSIFLYTGHLL